MGFSFFSRSRLSGAAFCVLLLANGCDNSERTVKHALRKADTLSDWEAAVSNLVYVGMSRDQVIQVFGSPLVEHRYEDGTVFLLYRELGDPNISGPQITGIQIYLSDNKVIRWRPVYTVFEPPRKTVLTDEASGGCEPTPLDLYLVRDHYFDGSRYINTRQLPNLGLVGSTPSLRINRLKSVLLEELNAQAPGTTNRFVLMLYLIDTDAESFGLLTHQNIGRRLLIAFEGNPVVAPVILEPIKTGVVQLEVSEEDKAREIYRKLKLLLVEDRGAEKSSKGLEPRNTRDE